MLTYRKHFNVFLMGSSTTQCLNQTDTAAWGHLLQNNMRRYKPEVDVYNASFNGHTIAGVLYIFDNYILPLKPDVIIVNLGKNEFLMNFKPGYMAKGNPYDNSTINGLNRRKIPAQIIGKSRFLSLVAIVTRKLLFNLTPKMKDYRSMNSQANPFATREITHALPADSSVLCYRGRFSAKLEELIGKCKTNNVALVFVSTPSTYLCFPGSDTSAADRIWVDKKSYVISYCDSYRLYRTLLLTIKNVCETNKVSYYDADDALAHKQEYFMDDFHLNDAGCKVFSDSLGAFILKNVVLRSGAAEHK